MTNIKENETSATEQSLSVQDWRTYGEVYGFAGNELLMPMNRSGNVQGLSTAFWVQMPLPPNDLGMQGMAQLERYAKACEESQANNDDPHKPGMMAASVEYAHLFIGPPKPTASPWETTNDPFNVQKVGYGRATIEMRRLLAQEGMELEGVSNQYEDHIGVELLYMALLCDRMAQAVEGSDNDEAAEYRGKCASFLDVHLLAWIGRLRESVEAERPQGYYAALLQYVHGVLEDHRRSL